MQTMTAVEFQELEKQGKVTKTQKFSNIQLTYDLTKGKNIYVFGQWAKKDFKVGHFNNQP
jgi:hypothetical protein